MDEASGPLSTWSCPVDGLSSLVFIRRSLYGSPKFPSDCMTIVPSKNRSLHVSVRAQDLIVHRKVSSLNFEGYL